jgi:hypothetical protein
MEPLVEAHVLAAQVAVGVGVAVAAQAVDGGGNVASKVERAELCWAHSELRLFNPAILATPYHQVWGFLAFTIACRPLSFNNDLVKIVLKNC